MLDSVSFQDSLSTVLHKSMDLVVTVLYHTQTVYGWHLITTQTNLSMDHNNKNIFQPSTILHLTSCCPLASFLCTTTFMLAYMILCTGE